MRFVLATAGKDLRRKSKDPVALLTWVGIPALVGLLLSLIGGGGAAPTAHVLVADQDQSFVSALVAGGSGLGDVVTTESVELEEGRRRMAEGDATALLVLPEGFQQSLFEGTPSELTLLTNPSQTILPKIVEEALDILLELVFYVQQKFGDELAEIPGGAPSTELFEAINEKVQSLEGIVFPPVLTLAVETSEDAPPPGFGFLFLPGIVLMSLMFSVQGMSDDVWAEKSQGTLSRVLASPPPIAAFLAGKALAAAVLVAGVALVGLLIGVAGFGLGVSKIPLAMVWCGYTGIVMYFVFLSVQLLATTPRAGSVLSNVLLFPMIMVGGSFFPFESMPEWMVRVGSFTPNGRALLVLRSLLGGEASASQLLGASLAIGLPAALLFAFCLWRLPRFATD